MASNPPAKCCTEGVRHEGEPTGSVIKIGNIDVYVAEPKGSVVHKDTAILYLPDVISIWQNSKLMADQYAANGYYTIIPDLFSGDALALERPDDFDFMGWMSKHGVKEVEPIVLAALKYLKEEKGFKKIGSTGYCFGAKYTVRSMKQGGGIDVGYVAHPSFVDEAELSAIAGPLSIAAAETDAIFPTEKRHKSEVILQETKQPYQINLFSGVSHGFSVRCDTSIPIQKFAKEQAFLQAISWFDQYLV
ncbi:dienelactone hydrolase [Phlyctema vagabunda]|uniref:Dienelactone hydrolase n=1 Tax=Phlyctema vagabunda TaxID=108571 RepID=A0ABR4PU32_9HELO